MQGRVVRHPQIFAKPDQVRHGRSVFGADTVALARTRADVSGLEGAVDEVAQVVHVAAQRILSL